MKRLFLIIISLCLASCWQSYATPQMGDILIWEGESWEMNGISPFEFMEKDDYKLIQDLVERRGEKVHEVLKELEYDPPYPGKYQATIKIRQEIDSSILDNSFPDDHYFMNCDLVRLSDDAASKVLEVEKYPDYLIDIFLKTPWETSFVCGGALFKKESCGRWFYKKTKGSPENRFLSQGDVIVYEIPDPEKLSAKVFRKRPKR